MTTDKVAFGDFQTPPALAIRVVAALARQHPAYRSILEPTCGRGSLLLAATERLGQEGAPALGFDINPTHLREASEAAATQGLRVQVNQADFFQTDWDAILQTLPDPVLIIGNPPWVTNAELGRRGSPNLPTKSNFQRHRGFDALTGKSNFDISEWMLLQNLRWLEGRNGTIAMLVKHTVARKILRHIWQSGYPCSSASLYFIDALKHFNAAVEACLLVLDVGEVAGEPLCEVFDTLEDREPSRELGYYRGNLVSDLDTCLAYDHLLGGSDGYTWRSGLKHDHSKIMEFTLSDGYYENGLGERYDLEDVYIFPLLKSSDVAKGNTREPRKQVLVTQQAVGDPTSPIQQAAPKTWAYLHAHRSQLDARKSSIYRGRPPFSVFGVGEYTFSPWKVAVSGFYKTLNFQIVPPYQGRPVMLDDTVYFLPSQTEEEASTLARLLNHPLTKRLLTAQTFFGDKRPITIDVLKRLDLYALSRELDLGAELIGKETSNSRHHPYWPRTAIAHETEVQPSLWRNPLESELDARERERERKP